LLKIGEKLGIKGGDLSAWYQVPWKTIVKYGGGRLLSASTTKFKLLSAAFPEHGWNPWFFNRAPKKVHDSKIEHIEEFAKYLEKKLDIETPDGWYKVTRPILAEFGFRKLFESQANFVEFLQRAYPNTKWDIEKMAWSTLGWSHLYSALSQLFGKSNVIAIKDKSDEKKPSSLMVLKAKLIFEYHSPTSFAEQIIEKREYLTMKSTANEEKPSLSSKEENSFTHIIIPFWWNRQKKSLLAEIFRARKDLFEDDGLLSKWLMTAATYDAIPDSVRRKDLNLNPSYLRAWSNDNRFSHL
jgi:hypothetical protein